MYYVACGSIPDRRWGDPPEDPYDIRGFDLVLNVDMVISVAENGDVLPDEIRLEGGRLLESSDLYLSNADYSEADCWVDQDGIEVVGVQDVEDALFEWTKKLTKGKVYRVKGPIYIEGDYYVPWHSHEVDVTYDHIVWDNITIYCGNLKATELE